MRMGKFLVLFLGCERKSGVEVGYTIAICETGMEEHQRRYSNNNCITAMCHAHHVHNTATKKSNSNGSGSSTKNHDRPLDGV
jgi:hypothetical protein